MGKGALAKGIFFTADIVLSLLTVALGVATVMCYIAPTVDPNTSRIFPFLGLIAPFLYMLNIVVLLFWTIRWKPIAVVPLVALLLGAGQVNKYYRPELSIKHETARETGTVRIMTYNVSGFWSYEGSPRRSTMEDIKAYVREQDPDIVCFQEFEVNSKYTLDDFMEGMDGWRYNQISYIIGDGSPSGWGLAVFSKYPLTGREVIRHPGSNGSSTVAGAVVRRDTIRIFNNHLQTTQVNEEDREFLDAEALYDSERGDKAMNIARKLIRNFRLRAVQADSIALRIHESDRGVVVCGDFNDTPSSYTYRTIKGGLTDAFRTKGHGAVSTYKELWGIFRIDYIFHSRDYATVRYYSDDLPWSDHDPVVVDIKRK